MIVIYLNMLDVSVSIVNTFSMFDKDKTGSEVSLVESVEDFSSFLRLFE